MSLPITPETKIGALLEAYPEVEQILIAWAPAFEKLRNPILRKTVAKVATIEQAARIGGVSVREMVCKLREAVGQTGPEVAEDVPATQSDGAGWLARCAIADDIDADDMLARGVHPGGRVRQGAAKLKPGEVIRLKSSFRPEPLIHAMREGGFEVHSFAASPNRYVTYFGRGRTTLGPTAVPCQKYSDSPMTS
jgi:hypothetical protein